MIQLEIIRRINDVLADYFTKHQGETVKAKEMMDHFVQAGIFSSDVKGGLPIRKILRELDSKNLLNLIPYVHAVRKSVNTNWFFTDTGGAKTIGTLKTEKLLSDTSNSTNKIISNRVTDEKKKVSDEDYVIDLCDEVLGLTASRQHCFDFLTGDTGRKLPTDAYYQELNLVVEFRERQHTESVRFWNKPTASGIPRDEQRARYDQRRRDILPQHGITLLEISYSNFPHDTRKRLLRNRETDIEIIRRMLNSLNINK